MKRVGAVLISALVLALSVSLVIPMSVGAAAPVISSVQHSAVAENSAVVTWVTDVDATTNVEYGMTTAYGSSAPATADTTADSKNHAVVISGLAAGTIYHYRVVSDDGLGNVTYSADQIFTTRFFTISGVAASSITANSAIITWNTSVAAAGNVEYGTTSAYGSSAPMPADTTADSTAHFVVLSGLSPGTDYHYRVKTMDGSGNEELSEDMTFTTLATTAPTISGVGPTGNLATTTTASIIWNTDQKATSQVEYGTTSTTHGNYGYVTSLDIALINSHSVLLGGLSPDTTYYYRVVSKNVYDDEAVSGEYSFKTAADTSPPLISGVTVPDIKATTAVIAWDTDEPATSQVEYGTTIAYGSTTPLEVTLVTEHIVGLSGLTPGVTYYYRVRSTDDYANEAVSANYTFATSTDATAPVITGVNVTNITTNTVTIEWTTDEMATSQVLYGLATPYDSVTVLAPGLVYTHSVSISGLQSGTTYHFAVKSADAFGNESISTDATFDTLDDVAPTEPQNLSVETPEKDNTPTFTWDAATDAAAGVASYQVRIDSDSFADIGNVTTFTVDDTASLSDGSHTFEVRAVDNAGNIGDAGSLVFNIDATPPTAPANVSKTTLDKDNTPTFTWDAATDAASGLERYQVSIDSGDFTDIGSNTNFTVDDADALSDGSHTFAVRAVDRAGNTGEVNSVTFMIDATPPTAPVEVRKTTADGVAKPAFAWDAADDATSGIASYQVRIDSGEFADIGNVLSFELSDALANGQHEFQVRAVDAAGNVGPAASLTFDVGKPRDWLMIVVIAAGGLGIIVAAASGIAYWRGRRHAA